MRVLFILKSGCGYGHWSHKSSGLFNSASACAQMLEDDGIPSKVVEVVDNNCIDREVHKFRPTHVIIEALWVVPEKFSVLSKLHPKVKWIIRVHSKIPFLANEGMAVDWLLRYGQYRNVFIAFNDHGTQQDFYRLTKCERPVLFLPNYYIRPQARRYPHNPTMLNVACLGAIRPLKNQLIQAIAAIEAADEMKKILHFHINADRVEMAGSSILKNLRALFSAHRCPHVLVEHPWMDHDEMLRLISKMDVGMQVSLSETFCIMAADFVFSSVPVVLSNEIPWASSWCVAATSDAVDIAEKTLRAARWPWLNVNRNRAHLVNYSRDSQKWWLKELEMVNG